MDEHSERALEMIAAERRRQIEIEGFTAEHDAKHSHGELSQAAAAYALYAEGCEGWASTWPWNFSWWKPTTPLRDLTKAGALIAAEIARRLRAGEKP